MKTLCLYALIFILVAGKPLEIGYTFRDAHWGMTMEEVMEKVDLTPINMDENTLVYRVRVLRKSTMLVYRFVDSKLSEVQYTIDEVHTDENDSIRDYRTFQRIITQWYGPPQVDEHFWKDELFKDNKGDWGIAVSLGHLFYNSEWETPHGHIRSILIGKDHKITCGVRYSASNEEEKAEVQLSSSSSTIPRDIPEG